LVRSAALAEEVRETLQTYVPNASFKTASDMLNKTNVCIIAGIPGIGKTTLARVLVAEYLTVKFELIEIYDAEEADRVWDDSVPQLFYFDDFLGEATLTGKAKSNEGSALLRLLKRISKAPNKKIILTTREYILAQAQQRSERLAQHNFSPLTCTLDLENYTSVIRAEMLYNHVFHSEIPPDNKAAFALPHIYLPIISHRNFNPRLIALSLEIDNAEAEEPADTASRVLDNLEDPARIWEHIVENQLGNAEVDVLIVLFSLPLVARDDLFEAWFAYRDSNSELDGDRQFRRALKTLDGSMVRATQLRDIPALRGHAGDDHGPSAFIDAGLLASHHDIGLDHLVPKHCLYLDHSPLEFEQDYWRSAPEQPPAAARDKGPRLHESRGGPGSLAHGHWGLFGISDESQFQSLPSASRTTGVVSRPTRNSGLMG
jgi:hypothetical protein